MTIQDAVKVLQQALNEQGANLKVDGLFGPLTEKALKSTVMKSDLEPALKIIKKWEGCKLEAYLDVVGVPTIGFGHTGPEVKLGQKITQAEADALLAADVKHFAEGVEGLVHVKCTPNQFCALVSFSYNVGLGALKGSSLLRKFNSDVDLTVVAKEFDNWIYAGSKVYQGLVNRRNEEQALFLEA